MAIEEYMNKISSARSDRILRKLKITAEKDNELSFLEYMSVRASIDDKLFQIKNHFLFV